MKEVLLHAASIIVGITGFLILNKFWGSYFVKKGENQATKEDIGQITEIVEDIKIKLLQETEIMKAQISVNNQHKLNLKTVERDSILDFHKKAANWTNYLGDVYLRGINDKNIIEITEKINSLARAFNVANDTLQLFINNKEFIIQVIDFKEDNLKLHEHIFEALGELNDLNKDEYRLIHAQTDESVLLENIRKNKKTVIEAYEKDKMALYRVVYTNYINLFDPLRVFLANLEEEKP
ncbi:hypothetical protein D3C87_719950 [compost metagenome]